MMESFIKNQLTLKRYRRFKSLRRSVFSVGILLVFLFISLTAEFWANSQPIFLRFKGHWYFPVFRNYSPDEFGVMDQVRMNYRDLQLAKGDIVIWPIINWDPYESNSSVESYPAPPSKQNIFGTDDRGRDVLSRLIYGFRYSIGFAILVWFFSLLLGVMGGALMGYWGGKLDLIGQRVVEIFDSMPTLLILITLVSIFGSSLGLLVMLSVFFGWMMISTYIRAEFLKLRKKEFVESARAQGVSSGRMILRHILPNALNPIITFSPFMIAAEIYALAALDYLGMGLPPPTPSWGELLQQAQNSLMTAWWLVVFPSVAMILTLTALNLVGEGLREAFDPRKTS